MDSSLMPLPRLIFIFLMLLLACGEEPPVSPEAGPPPGEDILLGSPETFGVRVSPNDRSITLTRGDTDLLVIGADGLAVGTVPTVVDGLSYDPYALYADSPLLRPNHPGLWRTVQSLTVSEHGDGRATIELDFTNGGHATLSITELDAGRFHFSLSPVDSDGEVVYTRLQVRGDPDEGFYGLGEYYDHVNHRGQLRAMQIEVDGELESAYNEAHLPVPFVTGTTGWGLFVASDAPAVFGLGREDPEAVQAVFGYTGTSEAPFDFFLYAAEHPLDITRHYYETTGYPARPAPWALGPLVWRDENDDQAQVLRDVNTMRDLDLPATGYWIDRPYATGVNTFDFDPTMFEDATQMIEEMHGLGFRVALWHAPYLDEEDPATASLRAEAEANGYFPPEAGLSFNQWSLPIDLTHEGAFAWWGNLIQRYRDLGVEGFKLDYAEDVVVGGLGGVRNRWRFADGSDERTMHAAYQRLYHRVYAERLPEDGGFLICRGGTWGDQRHVSVVWPGDLDANFARHRETRMEGDESYQGVGGLPAALVAGLSLGPSGFPLYGSDTGGYRHAPPDKETFARWFQVTAVSTVMQIGTNTNDVAWEPTAENEFDAEMLDAYRKYTRLHLRLFPYLWSLLDTLYTDGRSIQRPTGLAFPELGVHPDDTFLLGDSIFAAPVIERDARTRTFRAPPGTWIDWWSGEPLVGGEEHLVDAPLYHLPLYLRAGGIVPLLRPSIDTLSPTTSPERVDSFASDAGRLFVRIAPGDASEFSLFDGGRIAHAPDEAGWRVEWSPGERFVRGVLLEIIGVGARPELGPRIADGDELPSVPSASELAEAPAGWAYEESRGGTLYVILGAEGGTVIIPGL